MIKYNNESEYEKKIDNKQYTPVLKKFMLI